VLFGKRKTRVGITRQVADHPKIIHAIAGGGDLRVIAARRNHDCISILDSRIRSVGMTRGISGGDPGEMGRECGLGAAKDKTGVSHEEKERGIDDLKCKRYHPDGRQSEYLGSGRGSAHFHRIARPLFS
jgi:hypothetical protein